MELEIDFPGLKYTLKSYEKDVQYYPLLWIEAVIADGVGSLNKRLVGPGYWSHDTDQYKVGKPCLRSGSPRQVKPGGFEQQSARFTLYRARPARHHAS
jgi:hypothetical protein